MIQRTLLILTIALALIPPPAARAQTVSLEEFEAQLIRTHPVFASEPRKVELRIESRRGLLGAEDWRFSGQAAVSHLEPSIALFGPDETNAFAAEGRLERRFWSTGGRLSASYAFTRAGIEIDPAFGFPDAYYEHVLGFTYTHPLLRNRNGLLDRLAYDLSAYDIDFVRLAAEENMESFLAAARGRFLDWVLAVEQRAIVQERVRLSEEELRRTERKREANLVDRADVIRAEDAVRIARQNLVLVESQAMALQEELAILTQDSSLRSRQPAFDLYAVDSMGMLDSARLELRRHSRVLAELNVRLDQLAHRRSGFVEQTRADLDVFVSANTKRADPGFGTALQIDRPDATVGLKLAVPIGNRTARSRVTQADLSIMQLEDEIARVALDLESAYAGLHIQMQQLRDILQLNREQIESARERTTEELKLYDQGRGELTFVIQSRDNEQNARLTYAQNAQRYHRLRNEADALLDRLYRPAGGGRER
jgi:outer membrane protein TolC